MPRVEQTLARYLSPDTASSLKVPRLPVKPLKAASALMGKAYLASGQAGACRRTIAMLQAYQADLLNDLDKDEELCRATDLSLCATKTAQAIGHALVAMESQMWLNLSEMQGNDRFFLLDALLLFSGPFG